MVFGKEKAPGIKQSKRPIIIIWGFLIPLSRGFLKAKNLKFEGSSVYFILSLACELMKIIKSYRSDVKLIQLKIKEKAMRLIEQINDGIKESMRSKDTIRLNTLRMLKSKILAVDARGELSDEEVLKLFKTYFGNLQEAQEQAEAANRPETVEQLKSEIAIVQDFLPKALTPEETKAIVVQAIAESGAKTKKDFGLVMKSIMKLSPSVDGKLAKGIANQLLLD